ncbi:MAG: carbon-nitrogen hydrolase family protein [Dehalococcoidales bacterium]|nr:MAG: carbon-nitrogen hydrolase family protein [Dehalococcoidales bacterium]
MKITVAAIQMESLNGDYEGNRKRAGELINDAAKKGARLIALPEFALAGYIYDDEIWKEAEPLMGRTYRWLSEFCDQHEAYITTCILERDGEDFYDTLILCGPGGKLWSHRKVEPAAHEAFFFRGAGPNECVFDTPIGKVGVVICFDTSKTYSIKSLSVKRPDVLLILYSCPAMPGFFPRRYRQNWLDTYHDAPAIFAKNLHTPVISCNKTGDFLSPMPMGFGMQYNTRFIDRTSIVDNNGTMLSEINGSPGAAVAIVETKSAADAVGIKIPSGRWFLPISHYTRFITEIIQRFGKIRYATSQKRRMAASQFVGHD